VTLKKIHRTNPILLMARIKTAMPGDEVEAVEIETVTAVKKKAKLQMEPVHNLNRKILKLRRVPQPHHHKTIQMLKAPEEIKVAVDAIEIIETNAVKEKM
jgi:hypothetical protein